MQSVNDKWYHLYHRISLFLAALLAAACTAAVMLPQYKVTGSGLGLNIITLGLAVTHLIYALGIYPFVVRRTSLLIPTFVISLFQTLTIITLIQGSGKLHSWFILLWLALSFAIGMFGTPAIIGSIFLTITYTVAILTNHLEQNLPLDAVQAMLIIGGGIAVGVAGYFLWRTQYAKAENQRLAKLSGMLANKDQQAEILIESIADGIVIINTEGKISLMNTVAAEMSEWPIDEALGIDVQLVMKMKSETGKEIPPAEHPFAKALIQKEKIEQTMQLIGRNGKEIIISLVVSPVIIPNRKDLVGVVAVLRDISTAKAEEGRRADFVSTASHEMRTPVAAIEGYLQLALNDKVSQIDAKARSYLEKALDSTHHLGKLFQDLLTSAKAEDGRLVSHPVVIEMGAYLENLSDSLKFSAEKKGLLMEFTVGASQQEQANAAGGGKVIKPLYYIHADPDRLREVITNIFDNGVKYTDTGKISIALTGNQDVVQIYVKDTGPGIPPDDVPHLFQKFYRVDSTATRTIGGTGLGLFICRKIVEMYKGRIWVESTVGQGSTFYINLPRLSSQRAAELQAQEPAQPTAV